MSKEERESTIRLVLLDAHALFRVSLSRLLAAEPGFEVVSECSEPAEALKVLSEVAVDLVLLDFHFCGIRADRFMSTAKRAGYRGRFLVVTAEVDSQATAAALKTGAAGIFLKSDPPERLQEAIRFVMQGGIWLDQQIIQILNKQIAERQHAETKELRAAGGLTERQNEVLIGISQGFTNKKIGECLGLSEGSIKSVVQQLFYKAGVRTRSQLVRAALDGSLGTTSRT